MGQPRSARSRGTSSHRQSLRGYSRHRPQLRLHRARERQDPWLAGTPGSPAHLAHRHTWLTGTPGSPAHLAHRDTLAQRKKISFVAALTPIATMMMRSACGGRRRPALAPIRPPAVDPAATRSTASQATWAKMTKTAAAVALTIVTRTFLAALIRCSGSVR